MSFDVPDRDSGTLWIIVAALAFATAAIVAFALQQWIAAGAPSSDWIIEYKLEFAANCVEIMALVAAGILALLRSRALIALLSLALALDVVCRLLDFLGSRSTYGEASLIDWLPVIELRNFDSWTENVGTVRATAFVLGDLGFLAMVTAIVLAVLASQHTAGRAGHRGITGGVERV